MILYNLIFVCGAVSSSIIIVSVYLWLCENTESGRKFGQWLEDNFF